MKNKYPVDKPDGFYKTVYCLFRYDHDEKYWDPSEIHDDSLLFISATRWRVIEQLIGWDFSQQDIDTLMEGGVTSDGSYDWVVVAKQIH